MLEAAEATSEQVTAHSHTGWRNRNLTLLVLAISLWVAAAGAEVTLRLRGPRCTRAASSMLRVSSTTS